MLHELLRRGVNLNQQVWQDPHSGQRGPVDDGVQLDWKKEFVSLFGSTQHLPTYFDCCFAWHVCTSMGGLHGEAYKGCRQPFPHKQGRHFQPIVPMPILMGIIRRACMPK